MYSLRSAAVNLKCVALLFKELLVFKLTIKLHEYIFSKYRLIFYHVFDPGTDGKAINQSY